jgi:cysteine dioxygenase
MLALGWNPGHKSWIHNHHGQHCWMIVSEGTLGVRNYRRLGCDQKERTVRMEPLPDLMVSTGSAATVDPVEPIHLVWNPEELHTPALSIHIYSMPFDTCVIYDAEKGQCRNVKLFYTTMYGKLQPAEPGSFEASACACVLNPGDQKTHCGA